MSFLQATIEHIANKGFPLLIISFLIFAKFSFTSWQPYVILGLIFFIQRYHFKLGYYSSILENGVINYEEESKMEE